MFSFTYEDSVCLILTLNVLFAERYLFMCISCLRNSDDYTREQFMGRKCWSFWFLAFTTKTLFNFNVLFCFASCFSSYFLIFCSLFFFGLNLSVFISAKVHMDERFLALPDKDDLEHPRMKKSVVVARGVEEELILKTILRWTEARLLRRWLSRSYEFGYVGCLALQCKGFE